MTELEWVNVDNVGGRKQWGDVSRLVIGRERERKFIDDKGKGHIITEKVVKIERLDNGAHVVYTTSSIPKPEGE